MPPDRPRCTHSWFDRALVVAGLPPTTIHDLRPTAAPLPVSSGPNVKPVRKLLGHASAATTLDVHTDRFDDDLIALAQRLDETAARSGVVETWSSAAPQGP